MECIMQQSLPSEGSESYRSSSPPSDNDECDALHTQKCSEKGNNYNDPLYNLSSSHGRRNLTCDDLDTMVQSYKQLGGELELNLKILENNRLSLNKILTETKQECEILSKQKECQKKNLVDLQIRLENLDAEKMNIWHENQQDKLEKFEAVKQEMQIISENDAYVSDTYSKFIEILNVEKARCEDFFSYSKKEIELHKKEGINYINEVKEIDNTFKFHYEELLKQESKIIEDLKDAAVCFKSIINSNKTLEEKMHSAKKELEALEKDNRIFKTSIFEKNSGLNDLKTEYGNSIEMCQNTLNKLNEDILDFKIRLQQNMEEKEETNMLLSSKKEELKFLSDENLELTGKLSNFELNNNSESQVLNELVECCSSLKCELESLIDEQQKLESETASLPVLSEKLSTLEAAENDLSCSLQCLSEKEKQLKTENEEKENEFKNINLSLALSELEISKSELNEAMANESQNNENLQEQRTNFEQHIKEKEKELDEIKLQISENETKYDEYQKQMDEIRVEVYLLKDELLNQESKLIESEEKDNDILKNEEELQRYYEEIISIEQDLISSNEELENVKIEVDENESIHDLESTFNNIVIQIEEIKTNHEKEIDLLKVSYEKQEKIYCDKANREIGEINRKSLKEEAHERRVSLAVPRLNNEMAELESDLKKLLPQLSKEIKSGLDIIDELCTFYGQMFDSKQDKGKATIIRNLTSIEEQLASPMKCMMTLDCIPKINLSPPTRDGYLQILKSFREKFMEITEQIETGQPLEMAHKLQEMGSCLFGKKYVKPPFNSQVLNDTEISSSTEVYF